MSIPPAGNGEQERLDGLQLMNAGNVQAAAAAFGRAAELGDVEALMLLGGLRKGGRDLDGADAAFALAEQRGHPEAALMLGSVAEERGDDHAAIAAYRRGDSGGSVGAAFNLGQLLQRQGDLEGAKAAWRRADDRGDAEAAFYFGIHSDGEVDRFAALLRASDRGYEPATAMVKGSGLESPEMAVNIGRDLWARHDLKAAAAAFQRADKGGSADGADCLGLVLSTLEDQDGALDALRRADKRGSALGAIHLGEKLLQYGGDLADARAAFVRAGSRDPTAAVSRRVGYALAAIDQAGDGPGACQTAFVTYFTAHTASLR